MTTLQILFLNKNLWEDNTHILKLLLPGTSYLLVQNKFEFYLHLFLIKKNHKSIMRRRENKK